jgi:N-acetylneuraminic acid mutarotase
LAGAAAGNLILFAGGVPSGVGSYSDRVDVFDTSTRSWLNTTNLSQPRAWLAGAAEGNLVLFAGGENTGEKQGDNSLLFSS